MKHINLQHINMTQIEKNIIVDCDGHHTPYTEEYKNDPLINERLNTYRKLSYGVNLSPPDEYEGGHFEWTDPFGLNPQTMTPDNITYKIGDKKKRTRYNRISIFCISPSNPSNKRNETFISRMDSGITDIQITKIDNTHIKVDADESIKRELSDYFTFPVPEQSSCHLYETNIGMETFVYMHKLLVSCILDYIMH